MSTQLAQAVVRVREMILRGKLAPGQRVAEAPLADLLGMSRTPVRQALPMLAQEGLLTEHETRGYVVRAFTESDVTDALDLRAVLEGLAARRIAEKGAPRAFIRELRNCLEDGDQIFRKRRIGENDEALYAEMNGRFHSLILDQANSPVLNDALERTNRVPFASPQALAFDRSNLEQMYDMLHYAHQQHHAVVDALEHGQSARAEALMREHANSVKGSINVEGFHLMSAEVPERLSLVR